MPLRDDAPAAGRRDHEAETPPPTGFLVRIGSRLRRSRATALGRHSKAGSRPLVVVSQRTLGITAGWRGVLRPLRSPGTKPPAPAAFAVQVPPTSAGSAPVPQAVKARSDVLPSASGESAELTGEAASAALPPLRRRSPRPPARTPSVPSAGVESLPTPDGRNPVQTSRSEGRAPPAPETGRTGGRRVGSGPGRPVRRSGPASTPMARLTKSGLGLPGPGHVERPLPVARERSCRGSGGIPQPEFL